MKNKLPIILSLIAILGVVSVWGLWLCESLELTVVSYKSIKNAEMVMAVCFY